MDSNEIIGKVERHSVELENLNNKVKEVSDANKKDNELLIKVSTLVDFLVEDGKQRNKASEKRTETLVNINQNLSKLNEKCESVDKRVCGLENKFQESQEKDGKYNIDSRMVFKNFLIYFLTPSAILGTIGVVLKMFKVF
jgi:hypothetical protein